MGLYTKGLGNVRKVDAMDKIHGEKQKRRREAGSSEASGLEVVEHPY